jgi:hypothetical protein
MSAALPPHRRPSVGRCGLLGWGAPNFLGGRRPTEFRGGTHPCAENEKHGWNQSPFIREKILAKNGTTTYRQQFVCRYIEGCFGGFATSRPGQASDGSPRSRSGNFAILAAMRRGTSLSVGRLRS